MQLNSKRTKETLNKENPVENIKRVINTSLLWETNYFYDNEGTPEDFLEDQVDKLKEHQLIDAVQVINHARNVYGIRHMPLYALSLIARRFKHRIIQDALYNVIARPDELGEFLAMYWKDGKIPIRNQVKKGLAAAFTKFNEYQFAKYNRDRNIRICDVMALVHPKPLNDEQAVIFNKIANNQLAVPDTWEVNLSQGKDKKETFTRLLLENKLGALALIRNLRLMLEVGVDPQVINNYFKTVNLTHINPFQLYTAIKMVNKSFNNNYINQALEFAFYRLIKNLPKLQGNTCVLIDVSGSMFTDIGYNSIVQRVEIASALGAIAREVVGGNEIYTFSNMLVKIDSRIEGAFAYMDGIVDSQPHSSTLLGHSMRELATEKKKNDPNYQYQRTIIITDEQLTDQYYYSSMFGNTYIINVGNVRNGIYLRDDMTIISGFSDKVFTYIENVER